MKKQVCACMCPSARTHVCWGWGPLGVGCACVRECVSASLHMRLRVSRGAWAGMDAEDACALDDSLLRSWPQGLSRIQWIV
eukprot:1149598-Pelagomonas_calceolata.AAC.3